jgi:hypothetical protein
MWTSVSPCLQAYGSGTLAKHIADYMERKMMVGPLNHKP